MKLKDYLALPGKTATKLAVECGVSVSAITRAASGDTFPSRDLLASIAEKTSGAVMPNDFVEISAPAPAPEAEAA